MSTKVPSALFLILYTAVSSLYGQNNSFELTEQSIYYTPQNDEHNPCITAEEYMELDRQCKENMQLLGITSHYEKSTIQLEWPLRSAAGFTDCGYHFVSAYVDENAAAGAISDFNCGSNTYDTHRGTDIAIWPYGMLKMDNSTVEVIAAAAGTIVQKADGNFDRNCASNAMTANSIILQHADGSQTLYWHMKQNSLTSKGVGETVIAGEFLGVVGSSGNASGPHLHFEARTGNTSDTYVDPFAGTCNANSTWWTAQKPYFDPTVIKVSVNTTDIVIPGCPTTETPNESNSFAIPFQGPGLPAGYAKFYLFIRDDASGMAADCKILNPNGSTFSNWTYTSAANNKVYIKGYSKVLPTIPGMYTFQVTYNGHTCSTLFEITGPLGISEAVDESFTVFPNPANNSFTVKDIGSDSEKQIITLNSASGQAIPLELLNNNSTDASFSTSGLPNGIYFLTVSTTNSSTTQKLIVQHD